MTGSGLEGIDLTNPLKVRNVKPDNTKNFCFVSTELRDRLINRVRDIASNSGVEEPIDIDSWKKLSKQDGAFAIHEGPSSIFNVGEYLRMSSDVLQELRNIKTQGSQVINGAESKGVIQRFGYSVPNDLQYVSIIHPQIGLLTQVTTEELFTYTKRMGPKRVDILLSALKNNGFSFTDEDMVDPNKLLSDRENQKPIEI